MNVTKIIGEVISKNHVEIEMRIADIKFIWIPELIH
jgi:hypothetical protein